MTTETATKDGIELTALTASGDMTMLIRIRQDQHYGREISWGEMRNRRTATLCQELSGFSGCQARLYVWPANEALSANLANRRSRPYNWYKREVVPAVLSALGLPNASGRWSQKAGCRMCPCSPGFILDAQELACTSIHVTIIDGDAPERADELS